MKKIIVLMIVQALLMVSGCSLTASSINPLGDAEILPLCLDCDFEQISAERETNIFYTDPYSATSPMAEITDVFVIHNNGDDLTIRLIYPFTKIQDYINELTINGEPWTDWWGVLSIGDTEIARYDGTLYSKLKDGTYFQLAFPNWPELGEQQHYITPLKNTSNLSDDSAVSFYVQEIEIPAGGKITVKVNFDCNFVKTLKLISLDHEMPYTKHTVTVNAAENIGYTIDAQNLLEQKPDGFPWVAELSPEQTEYYITTEGIR